MTSAIATSALTKRFGKRTAVDVIDLDVPQGSVYGFLGPNGSGKTTTIRILLGLAAASEGTVHLLGERMPDGASAVLPRVGALVDGPAFHPYLSGRDNLVRLDAADRTATPADRRRRIDAALERVGLAAAAGKNYRAYSQGMRQRLGLAASLLRPRELLVLDEPTNGLDPQGTREVRHLVSEVAAAGTTVFLSSHLLSEVDQMCTHVGIMRSGALVAQGSISTLRSALATRLRIDTRAGDDAAEVLRRFGLRNVAADSTGVTGELGGAVPEDVVEELVKSGVPVRQVIIERPGLEELFVSLTGEGFDVDE
ncbi:ABC transporter ATP-binding protein [Phytoactinopolyspora halotolerans]|uniref:ATP-binding cassette domain-containing protein n=1 Tax=Phytoactinopolyspora halotolerans TaxID=1981512 RepID=A0A6L9SGJ6_9ACTN|nr:ATP-binding cassette domain-containing protein [Phytoactinopolyspora halotolerans]NEE04263.1 ATP-binding cassette domain-containing protein [Phytoactinopolyspora halotolerans]